MFAIGYKRPEQFSKQILFILAIEHLAPQKNPTNTLFFHVGYRTFRPPTNETNIV